MYIYIQPTPCVPFCSRRRVLRVNPEVPARCYIHIYIYAYSYLYMHICIHMCVCVCTCIRVNSLAPNPPGGVPTAAQAVSGRGEAAGHAPHRPFLPQALHHHRNRKARCVARWRWERCGGIYLHRYICVCVSIYDTSICLLIYIYAWVCVCTYI